MSTCEVERTAAVMKTLGSRGFCSRKADSYIFQGSLLLQLLHCGCCCYCDGTLGAEGLPVGRHIAIKCLLLQLLLRKDPTVELKVWPPTRQRL